MIEGPFLRIASTPCVSLASTAKNRMSSFHLVQNDAEYFLEELADESVDLVVTDPAYESLERHRSKGTTTRLKNSKASSNDWFEIFPNHRASSLFDELYRVMKPLTHAYILCDDPTDEVYRAYARDAGFWVWKSITWVKTKENVTDLNSLEASDVRSGMGYHWRASKENILFLEKRSVRQVCHEDWTVRLDPKGKGRQLNFKGWPDVLPFPPIRNGYPTEKPVGLLEMLILNSSDPGELVLDPFMGSGSTGEAALINEREFLGSDIGREACDVTCKRLVAAGGVQF